MSHGYVTTSQSPEFLHELPVAHVPSQGQVGYRLSQRRQEWDGWGPRSLTCRFRFDLLAELGTNTVVVGADVVQAPGGQLVGIVELQGSEQKWVHLFF